VLTTLQSNRFLLVSTALCLAVLLAACSGALPVLDEDDVPKTTERFSSLSLMAEIGGRMARSENAKYSVEYESVYAGETSTLAMYSDGRESFRFDTASAGGQTRTYTLGTDFYICSRDSGAFICLKSLDTGASQEVFPEVEALRYEDEVEAEEEAAAAVGFRAYKDGTFEVTGHVADCYGFEYPDSRERLCLSKEGIILFHETTGPDGTMTMRATSYRTSVAAGIFELPEGAQIADLDAEYAGLGNVYAEEIAEAEAAGSCFDACETQGLTDEELSVCFQTCV
jgi:hypothetical protein